jgi:hypothetical protein
MAAACKKSFQVRKGGKKTIDYKSAPWWTMELTIMRKKINAETTISVHHKGREPEGGQETTVSKGEKEIPSRA